MNFRNLRYFVAVAETSSITSAAAWLGISQQALSGHMAKLEAHFGLALLERTTPLRLTEAGERLYENARRILTLETATERDLRDIKETGGGDLTIGVTSARAAFLLPPLLREYHAACPNVRLHLVEGNSPEIVTALYKGTVDLAIGFTMDDPLAVHSEFLQEEYSFIVVPDAIVKTHFPQGVPRAGKKGLPLDVFALCPFVSIKPTTWAGSVFENCCKEAGFSPNIIVETGNIMTMVALCMAGLGVIVCPRIFLQGPETPLKKHRKTVHLFRLDYEPAHRQIALHTLRNRKQTAAVRSFIATAKMHLQ